MKSLIAAAILFFAVAQAVVAQDSATAGELKAREAALNQALLRSDWKTLEQIEADDLIFTNADGSVTHKSDDVAALRSGTTKFDSIDLRDAVVQDFGNVAVVTGQLTEKVHSTSADLSGVYRFTDVWLKRDGRWQLVTGHEALVPADK